MKELLKTIVARQGDWWPYVDVTSAQVSGWMGWEDTKKAKAELERLARMGYAVKNGREDKSRRLNGGATCCTFALRSDRVCKFLGIEHPGKKEKEKEVVKVEPTKIHAIHAIHELRVKEFSGEYRTIGYYTSSLVAEEAGEDWENVRRANALPEEFQWYVSSQPLLGDINSLKVLV